MRLKRLTLFSFFIFIPLVASKDKLPFFLVSHQGLTQYTVFVNKSGVIVDVITFKKRYIDRNTRRYSCLNAAQEDNNESNILNLLERARTS